MTWGPPELGRGVVVRRTDTTPERFADAERLRLDTAVLADPDAATTFADHLHECWGTLQPMVLEWDVPDDALSVAETSDLAPWRLDARFLFPLERLRFLIFTNNYDARSGEPVWWWARKAAPLGATPGGPADVVLPDGTPVWIDGGPRRPLPGLDHPVIHGESAELGLVAFVPEPMAAGGHGLALDQAEAVAHAAAAARIIAPAGSGKTRTLAARLRHLTVDRAYEPATTMAVAYNARAAAELRERTGASTSTVRTIHSLGWAVLGEARPGVQLIDEADVRNLVGRIVTVPKRTNTDPIGPYVEALDEVRAGLVDPETVEANRDDVPGFALAFDRYRNELMKRQVADHGEQVYGAIEVLLRDAGLRRRWQQRCRHLLVDEFQDLTPAYLLLLRLVASPELDVFGVGDDDQVIYGYAGADPSFLIDYGDYFPGSGAHALEVNYRCAPPIVTAATRLLANNRRRIDKTIRAGSDDSDRPGLEVVKAEGVGLAADAAVQVRAWLDAGVDAADIAVLARVNAALIPVKAALAEAGIPTDDLLGRTSINRTTLRALFAWMRMALHPETIARQDALDAVRRPGRGLNRASRDLRLRTTTSLDELFAAADQLDGKPAQRWYDFCSEVRGLAEVASAGTTADVVRRLITDVDLGGSARSLDAGRSNAAKAGHYDDLVAIHRAAALHDDPQDFIPWLRTQLDKPARTCGVTLSSVHRVKGMEWARVIVFGADRGAMPHDLSTDLEEERRVFHVAITRAVDDCVVMADAGRPSRFIAEMEGRAPEPAAITPPSPARSKAPTALPIVRVGDEATLRSGYRGRVVHQDAHRLRIELETGAELEASLDEVVEVSDGSPPPDAGLVDALKAWRSETSSRLGVPAYVVLHDSTLEAIARRRPATERELLSISGIGPTKLENYGDDLLTIVADTGE